MINGVQLRLERRRIRTYGKLKAALAQEGALGDARGRLVVRGPCGSRRSGQGDLLGRKPNPRGGDTRRGGRSGRPRGAGGWKGPRRQGPTALDERRKSPSRRGLL